MTRAEALSRLIAFADKNGQQALANKLGCTRSYVSLLLRDERSPGLKIAGILNREFKIPYGAWDRAA